MRKVIDLQMLYWQTDIAKLKFDLQSEVETACWNPAYSDPFGLRNLRNCGIKAGKLNC
jgi:hypothetical protein